MTELSITDAPAADVRSGILRAIDAYNERAMGASGEFRLLVIPLRDGAGSMAGGLWGFTWARWLFVELLVVPEAMRGSGLGTRMMQMAEAEARRRGCVGIWLDTHSFQARPFYEHLGYSVFATLADFPPGHAKFYLMKRLDRA
jgi:GNAT superfamily N-acetyltransferase